jgi:hypothetical protein
MKDKNATKTYKPRTGCAMQPRPRRPPCSRAPPHTTPAAPTRAQRRNAQINGVTTRTDRRVRSHSRKQEEGRHHDATGRERRQHQTSTERQTRNQHLKATHPLHDATKTKTPAVPPPATTHHGRRATPRPMPQRTMQRGSNQNRSPREKPLKDGTKGRAPS